MSSEAKRPGKRSSELGQDLAIRRYTFKLYPSAVQDAALRDTAALCASLWNGMLQRREDVYRREKRTLTAFDLGKEITGLRAEWPEFALSRSIMERVCGDLDNAFKAFFRRIKAGEREAGYPQYKSTRHASSIPMREMSKGGWKLTRIEPKGASGPCGSVRNGESLPAKSSPQSVGYLGTGSGSPSFGGGAQVGSAKEFLTSCSGSPSFGGGAQDSSAVERLTVTSGPTMVEGETQGNSLFTPAGKNWRFTLKSVPGTIRARGKFPAPVHKILTADVMHRDGAWWLSVAVEIEKRGFGGNRPLVVRFDLIDEFASIEADTGPCGAGRDLSEAQNLPPNHGVNLASGAEPSDFGGERREEMRYLHLFFGAEPSDFGGERRLYRLAFGLSTGAEPSDFGGERRVQKAERPRRRGAEPSDSEGERRRAEFGLDELEGTEPSGLEGERRFEVHEAAGCVGAEPSDLGGECRRAGGAFGQVDDLKSERDRRFRKPSPGVKPSRRWLEWKRRITRLEAIATRRRSHEAHVWSTSIVRAASALSVIAPDNIKELTSTARGDAKRPGAAVAIVAGVNRRILMQAPAAAIAMLEYKSAEAGIRFERKSETAPKAQIGKELSVAVKKGRTAARKLKKEAA